MALLRPLPRRNQRRPRLPLGVLRLPRSRPGNSTTVLPPVPSPGNLRRAPHRHQQRTARLRRPGTRPRLILVLPPPLRVSVRPKA